MMKNKNLKNILTFPLHLLVFKIIHRSIIRIRDFFNFRRAKSNHLSEKYEKLFLKNTGFYNSNYNNKYHYINSIFREFLSNHYWDELINSGSRNFIIENLKNGKEIIKNADLYCRHIFNLLGSGKTNVSFGLKPGGVENYFYYMNPTETEIENYIYKISNRITLVFESLDKKELKSLKDYGYEPIDWHIDFKSGYRWDRETWYKKVKFGDVPGADIKVPWELSRCYHFLTLGHAYFISGDEKYTKEFIYQFFDWVENNPIQFGVNWTCTMDVAIRSCNWILSFLYFKNSRLINREFLYEFIKNVFMHGLHIRRNLEKVPFSTKTNHYISNLAGLIYIGKFLDNLEFGKELHDFAICQLKKEIQSQVYDDGSSFEASTCYHRLVLELFFYPLLFLTKSDKGFNGNNFKDIALKIFGDKYVIKILKMFKVLKYCIKPDGHIPQIGDNDNGMLHVSGYSGTLDVTYLLQIASVFFNESGFKINNFNINNSVNNNINEILWLYGKKGYEIWKNLNGVSIESIESYGFLNSGWFIMRKNDNYLFVSAGQNGQNGNGGHAHNDKLSFELRIYGKSIIIDPGTFLYTASVDWRNKFRSTAFHNTVSIDKKEQNRFVEKSLFLLRHDSNVKINKWSTNEYYDLLDAEHFGFMRLLSPVIHRRQIIFDKVNIRIFIKDIIGGNDKHLFEALFHLSKDIEIQQNCSDNLIIFKNSEERIFKLFNPVPGELKFELIDGWISSGYGEKIKAPVARYSAEVELPFENLFIIAEENYNYKESDLNIFYEKKDLNCCS